MRVGTGFDVHRLVLGRKLVIGGIRIDYDWGLEGHSDGDALIHAIVDALLGAAGLGDIGMWFPPNDQKYAGANSLRFLDTVAKALAEKDFEIVNIDSQVICEMPKLSPFFGQMKDTMAKALQIQPDIINVKATTCEGLGFIGRSEAIAAQAVAIVRKK